MGDFGFYLREGFYHITDWKGYDHILFVMALCLPYFLNAPIAIGGKQVLFLITAFTIGHSVTLALSVFNKILVPSTWIEFLIPVTIMITAIGNVRQVNPQPKKIQLRYISALIFGLIHGMGFSNYLRSMMGKNENIISQLLAFNIGLELGQLLIVLAVLIVSFIFVRLLNMKQREWTVFISGGIFGISFIMALERLPF